MQSAADSDPCEVLERVGIGNAGARYETARKRLSGTRTRPPVFTASRLVYLRPACVIGIVPAARVQWEHAGSVFGLSELETANTWPTETLPAELSR